MCIQGAAEHPRRRPLHWSLRRCGALAAVAGSLTFSVAGCKPKTNAFVPPPAPEVTVAHPVRRPVTRYLEYTGTIEAYEAVQLRARVAGFLDKVNFKPGAAIKKDDLLFVIDPRVYEAQARQAQAEVENRKAALRLAELTLQRLTDAAQAGAATPPELDRARADRDQARAEVDVAEATLASASLNVEFTQVRAPIDGRITKNLVDVGNLVGGAGDPTVLGTLVSAKPAYVSVDVSESDTLMVRRQRLAQTPGAEPGQQAPGVWRTVDLATADSSEFNIHGHIDYVDPALDPQSGTIRVRCRFENEDEFLIPGFFVRIRIKLETSEEMLVPDIALLADQSGRYALVVNGEDVVELRRVRIGTLDGPMRVVVEGLAESDRVVVDGLQRARPGATVKPALKELANPQAAPAAAARDGAAATPDSASMKSPGAA